MSVCYEYLSGWESTVSNQNTCHLPFDPCCTKTPQLDRLAKCHDFDGFCLNIERYRLPMRVSA